MSLSTTRDDQDLDADKYQVEHSLTCISVRGTVSRFKQMSEASLAGPVFPCWPFGIRLCHEHGMAICKKDRDKIHHR